MDRRIIILGAGFDLNLDKLKEKHKSMIETLLEVNMQELQKMKKELRNKYLGICRCAQFGLCAANTVWGETFEKVKEVNSEYWSVMLGTAIGESTTLYHNQCRVLMEQGPMWLMPSIVTNKGPKVTADIFSIEKNLMGSSLTFESGRNSSGMAVLNAFDEIRNNHLDGSVVIGTEYIDDVLLEALKTMNYDCTYYTSGACALVLVSDEMCNLDNNFNEQIKLLSVEAVGGAGKPFEYSDELGENFTYTVSKVIEDAEIEFSQIDAVVYTSCNNETADCTVKDTIEKILPKQVDIISVGELLGDYIGANSAVALGLGYRLLKNQQTVVGNVLKPKHQSLVLIVSYTVSGSVWAAVIQKN
ncbi:MAG: hypothetical protein HDQ99_03860 [Lachnospiraceae bacterium]|nr:hypothetical protein [Lachnospiraceae bacterium]